MRRFRRLRGSEAMRRLVRETRISAEEMIYPIFCGIEGENIKNPIPSMPGVFQYSVDRMDEMLAEVAASGIAGVLIFGIPRKRMRSVCRRMPGRHHTESHSPYQKEVSLSACGCGCLPLRIYLAWALRLS